MASGMSPEDFLREVLQGTEQESPAPSMPELPAKFVDVEISSTKIKDYVSAESYEKFMKLKTAQAKAYADLNNYAGVIAKEAEGHPLLSTLQQHKWGNALIYSNGTFKGRVALSEITE